MKTNKIMCPDCHSYSYDISKQGIRDSRQRYKCNGCGGWFSIPLKEVLKKDSRVFTKGNRVPRLLLIDIETAPMRVLVWGLYKQRISPDNILTDWYILSWAAKWICESGVFSNVLVSDEAIVGDDERIIKGIWNLLNEADMVIAHNGHNFDIRKLNARFIYHGLPPPMPYKVIDTLVHARSNFAFSSFKQSYITKFLGLREKIDTNFELWRRCINGDEEALSYMERYNKQDVNGLEDVYFAIRPWIKSHPNMGVFIDTDKTVCPSCGYEDLEWGGYYVTPTGRYKAFRCVSCGSVGRSRSANRVKSESRTLSQSVAS